MCFKIAGIGIIIVYYLIDTWYMLQTHSAHDFPFVLHLLGFSCMTAITIKIMLQHYSRIRTLHSSVRFHKQRYAEETGQFSHLLDSLPCAVATIAPDFTIKAVNTEVTKLTGVTAEAAINRKCYFSFGDQHDICPGCPVKIAYQTKAVQQNLKTETTTGGREIFIEQTAIPILDTAGNVKHVLEIVVDATKRIKLEQEKGQLFVQTVGSLSKLIESRDFYTGAHSLGVENLAISIGRELNLDQAVIAEISIAALLHDIGKIGIMESILNKPGKLTPDEYAIIQRHPEIGYNALKDIHPLQNIAEDILSHHERFDGQGYPYGKQGAEIPLVARILSVADVYEAITADRVYRKAMTPEQVYEIMMNGRGTQFDPQIVDALFRVVPSWRKAN